MSSRTLPVLLVLVFLAPSWTSPAQAGEVAVETPSEGQGTSIEALREAWDANPDSVEAGVALQDALFAAAREAKARTLFRQAQLRDRKSTARAFLYGRVVGGRDGLRRMREALERDASLGDASTSGLRAAWRSLREAERAAGQWGAAASSAKRVLLFEPEAWDWAAAGWIMERSGDPAGAITAYERALALRSDYLWVRNALALLLARQGVLEKAVELARSTTLEYPKAGNAHLHLGLVLCLAGDKEAGREAYAAALRCAGNDADALAAVAAALTDLEDHELAGDALDRALRLEPGHERARLAAGVLALERGDPATALKHLDRAAKANPKDAHVAFLRGMCHERLGNEAKAVNDYRKAVRLRGDSVIYLTGLARALARRGSFDSAISILRKAIREDPLAADLQLQLGFLYIKKRKWSAALRAMELAADLDDEDARPWFYLAILYGDHLNRRDDALRALRRYEELGGKEPSALRWLKELEGE